MSSILHTSLLQHSPDSTARSGACSACPRDAGAPTAAFRSAVPAGRILTADRWSRSRTTHDTLRVWLRDRGRVGTGGSWDRSTRPRMKRSARSDGRKGCEGRRETAPVEKAVAVVAHDGVVLWERENGGRTLSCFSLWHTQQSVFRSFVLRTEQSGKKTGENPWKKNCSCL